jgi:hypothetical protein
MELCRFKSSSLQLVGIELCNPWLHLNSFSVIKVFIL